LAETKAVEAKAKEIENISNLISKANQAVGEALRRGDQKTADLKHSEFLQYHDDRKRKEEEMKPLGEAYLAKREIIAGQNAVYFEPGRENEVAVDNAKYTLAKTALESKAKYKAVSVLADGNIAVVDDYRGCKHWVLNAGRWESGSIALAGEFTLAAGAIWDFDLTEAQKVEIAAQDEADRVGALTLAEKDAEKAKELERVLGESVAMRSALEIQGATDPLGESQAWYNARVEEINLKYA
jgi:hypothetical protein